jgi:hypothetical protein
MISLDKENHEVSSVVCLFLANQEIRMKFAAFFVVFIASEVSCREKWVQMDPSKSLPANAVVGGGEYSQNYRGPLYIGRKQIGMELVVGKVIDAWKSGYCE